MSTSTNINFDRYTFDVAPPEVSATVYLAPEGQRYASALVTLNLGPHSITFGVHRPDTADAVAQALLKVAEFLTDNKGKLGRRSEP